jgi:predicted AAA+ superfamily ATPase
MIVRKLKEKIINNFKKNKINIIIGSRQTGKTTLCRMIIEDYPNKFIWLNGDEPDTKIKLANVTSTQLKALIGQKKLLIIDEAQRIKNIGLTLKLIYDNFPEINIIATGSSSFELTSDINEPLTGRKREFFLHPLSYSEMQNHAGSMETQRMLEHYLLYGFYPEVITNQGEESVILNEISQSYLYKDVLSYGNIKKPFELEKLIQAIALQIGNEVNFSELGQLIGVDNETIERWIDLLEKSFVIFRLPSLSRNARNEIKKGKKIYFYDNGIRNAIINNFNPLALRTDIGALWENFLISFS